MEPAVFLFPVLGSIPLDHPRHFLSKPWSFSPPTPRRSFGDVELCLNHPHIDCPCRVSSEGGAVNFFFYLASSSDNPSSLLSPFPFRFLRFMTNSWTAGLSFLSSFPSVQGRRSLWLRSLTFSFFLSVFPKTKEESPSFFFSRLCHESRNDREFSLGPLGSLPSNVTRTLLLFFLLSTFRNLSPSLSPRKGEILLPPHWRGDKPASGYQRTRESPPPRKSW